MEAMTAQQLLDTPDLVAGHTDRNEIRSVEQLLRTIRNHDLFAT